MIQPPADEALSIWLDPAGLLAAFAAREGHSKRDPSFSDTIGSMTPDAFRKLALALPETIEASHMNHPDFRVKGHIFASLASKGPEWGMVKISLERQGDLVESFPGAFDPASGAWGRAGCTMIHLPKAKADVVKGAMEEAWALLYNKPATKKRTRKRT